MHNVDDCLFRTSFSISIEGDADMRTFNADAERSFYLYVHLLGLKPISSAQEDWFFSGELSDDDKSHLNAVQKMHASGFATTPLLVPWNNVCPIPGHSAFDQEKSKKILMHLALFLKEENLAKRFEPSLKELSDEWMSDLIFGLHFISTATLQAAFADAYAKGIWEIEFRSNSYPLKRPGLCFCFELETSRNIYQCYWRSRWVLTLVNFLINSPRTSMRIFPRGAEIIRLLGKRLFKKPSLPRSRNL